MIEFFGNIAYIFIGLGILLVGKGHAKVGLVSQMIGSILWMCTGYFMDEGRYAIMFWNAVFTCTCGYGAWRWKKF